MGERVPMTVRVDEELKEEFDQFVKEHYTQKRGAKSEAMEDALSAHMEYGTEARMESKLDETLSLVREMHDAHTHKQEENTSADSPVQERTEDIAELVYTLDKPALSEEEVKDQIENYGFGDDRTKDKYLKRLKKWGLLYEDPSQSPVWYVKKEEWFGTVDTYLKRNPHDMDEILRPYPDGTREELEEYLESVADEEESEQQVQAQAQSSQSAIADGGDETDVIEIIQQLQSAPGTEVPYEDIADVAQSEGISVDEVDGELQDLREQRKIYSPRDGYYSLI